VAINISYVIREIENSLLFNVETLILIFSYICSEMDNFSFKVSKWYKYCHMYGLTTFYEFIQIINNYGDI